MSVSSGVIPFVAPLSFGAGGRFYFESPKPGRVRNIREVIVTDLTNVNLSQSNLQISSNLLSDLFALGSSQSAALAIGRNELYHPKLWTPGESIWLDAVVTPTSTTTGGGTTRSTVALDHKIASTVALTAAATQAALAGVPQSELVIGAAAVNLSAIANVSAATADSNGNNYSSLLNTLTTLSAPGLRLSGSNIGSAITSGSTTLQSVVSGAGASAYNNCLIVASFTGIDSLGAVASYGDNTNAATSTTPNVATTQSVTSGDLVIGATAIQLGSSDVTITQPTGFTAIDNINETGSNPWLRLCLAYSTTVSGAVTYNPVLSGSKAWVTSIAALSAASVTNPPIVVNNTPNLSVALAGDEYFG